jgi:hypothetical protein
LFPIRPNSDGLLSPAAQTPVAPMKPAHATMAPTPDNLLFVITHLLTTLAVNETMLIYFQPLVAIASS